VDDRSPGAERRGQYDCPRHIEQGRDLVSPLGRGLLEGRPRREQRQLQGLRGFNGPRPKDSERNGFIIGRLQQRRQGYNPKRHADCPMAIRYGAGLCGGSEAVCPMERVPRKRRLRHLDLHRDLRLSAQRHCSAFRHHRINGFGRSACAIAQARIGFQGRYKRRKRRRAVCLAPARVDGSHHSKASRASCSTPLGA